MRSRRGSPSIGMVAICTLGMAWTASGRVEAQYGYGYGYGYGGYAGSYGGFGNIGMSLYDQEIAKQQMYAESVSRYQLQTAQAAEAYQSASLMQQKAIATAMENERRAQALDEKNYRQAKDAQAEQLAERRTYVATHMDELFDPEGKVRWPEGAPVGGDLAARLQEANAAIQAANQEYRSKGQAGVQDVVEAKRALYAYGHPALDRLRSSGVLRSRYAPMLAFLQGLDAALDVLGGSSATAG